MKRLLSLTPRRLASWGLLWLLLGPGLRLAHGQTTSPFTVQVTPAGPLSLAYGQQVVLTAAATYPAFAVGTGFNGPVAAVVLQPDGKLLVGGSFTQYQGASCKYLVRLNPNGSRDASFDTGGGPSAAVTAIALQPADGQVLIGGSFTSYNGIPSNNLARLSTTGGLSTRFATGTEDTALATSKTITALAVQKDGKLVVGGSFTAFNGAKRNGLARFNADGSLDTGFAPAYSSNAGAVLALATLDDGRVLVGGGFGNYSPTGTTTYNNYIARFNANGSLDTAFAPPVVSSSPSPYGTFVTAIAVQDDGKVVLGGHISYTSGAATQFLKRLNADASGSVDFNYTNGFAGSVGMNTTTTYQAALQVHFAREADGKFLFSGVQASGTANYVARFDPSSNAATTITSVGTAAPVRALLVQPNGQAVLGGDFTNYLARLNADGSLNTADTPVPGATYRWSTGATTASLTVSTAGSYAATATAGGATATSNTVAVTVAAAPITPFTVQVTPAGPLGLAAGASQVLTAQAVYPAFAIGTGFDGPVSAVVVQADGKVLVGGSFTKYQGLAGNNIVRLNADGSRDASFGPAGAGFSGAVSALAVQADGKIVAVGAFTSYAGMGHPYVARLNADGSLDNSFAPVGTGLSGSVAAVLVQPDGKIVVGGSFGSYNGTTRSQVARLTATGGLDASFVPTYASSSSPVTALGLQADGKVLVGGSLSSYSSTGTTTERNYLARLNPDGSLDGAFVPPVVSTAAHPVTTYVNALLVQPDGKVLIGGYQSYVVGAQTSFVRRFTTDGALDFIYAGNTSPTKTTALALQADGKIWVGETSYGATGANNYLLRLSASGSADGFSAGSGSTGGTFTPVNALAVQPNGQLLLGGAFTSYNGTASSYLARLNADGSLNTADIPVPGATYRWSTGATTASLTVSTAGSYAATATAGGATATSNTVAVTVAAAPVAAIAVRVTTVGPLILCPGTGTTLTAQAVYPAFGTGMGFTGGNVNAVVVQPDGKVLVGGSFTQYQGLARNYLVRLDAAGVPDPTFTPASLDGAVSALAVLPDGKIMVGGSFSAKVARLTATGGLDPSFVPASLNGAVTGVAVQSDGQVVIIGGFSVAYSNFTSYGIARFSASGALSESARLSLPFIYPGNSFAGVAVQADQKIVVAGYFNLSERFYSVRRLNPDGSLDSGFNPLHPALPGEGNATGGIVSALAVQDGTILIARNASILSGSTVVPFNRVYRLDASGNVTGSYATGDATGDNVGALAFQADGKVLLGGSFTPGNGTTRAYLARLNADFSLNTAFPSNSGPNGAVAALAVQPNQQVLAGGSFTTFSGSPASRLVRFNADGSPNTVDVPVAGATYSWAPGGATTASLTVAPSATTTYIATATAAGATATSNAVTVSLKPVVVATPGNAVVMCSGETKQLGAAPVAGYTYSWSPTTGLSNPTSANPTVTRATTAYATYTYTLTVTNTTTGCVGTGTVNVYVYPLPAAVTGPAVVMCSGQTRQLGAAPEQHFTYRWRPATGLSDSTIANPTVTLSTDVAPFTRVYRLLVTGADPGCTNVGTVAVTVNPLPVANAGPDVPPICSGGSAQLGAAPVAGYAYSWSPATGLSNPTSANPTVTLTNTTSAPITQSYALTVTSAASGCQASSKVVVTVLPALTLTGASPAGGPVDTPVTLTGTNLGNVVAVTFDSIAAPIITPPNAAGTQLTVRVPPGTASGVVLLEVRTASGCRATIGFAVLRILVVKDPTPPVVQPGIYDKIIVTSTGVATVPTDVTVLDSVVVRTGGVLRLGTARVLDLPGGKGVFWLKAGATLSLGDPDGLTPTGTAAGAVQAKGQRIFSSDANYVYTGRSPQQTGAGLPHRVRNLTDSTRAGAALRLSDSTSVAQVLTLASAGNFNLSNHPLVLLSDSAGTALVVNGAAGGRVVGPAQVQRYFSKTYNAGPGYRYYSPPVRGALVNSLRTAGFEPIVNPDYNTLGSTVRPLPTVYRFDPARLAALPASLPTLSEGLASPGALTDSLAVGQGYALQLAPTAKVTVAGTLATGDYTLASAPRAASPTPVLAGNAGWNLVGNPYPAPISWDLVTAADRPGLDAAIYRYESTGPRAGTYTSYVNGIGESPLVALGQSFFVRVSKGKASGTLKLHNRHRLTTYGPPVAVNRPDGPSTSELDVELNHNGGSTNNRPPAIAYDDALAEAYRTGTTNTTTVLSEFNPALDADFLPSPSGVAGVPGYNISIGAPGQEYSIKALPGFGPATVVPLTVRAPEAGQYTIKATVIRNLPYAYLEDKRLQQTVSLSAHPEYAFTLSAAEVAGAVADRFVLRFGPAVVTATRPWTATADVALYPNPAHGPVTVQVPAVAGATEVRATLLNELGQVVSQQSSPLPATGARLLLPVQGLASGVYALRLQAGPAEVVRRLIVE